MVKVLHKGREGRRNAVSEAYRSKHACTSPAQNVVHWAMATEALLIETVFRFE